MSHSNINRVVIVGRLTRDPELRTLPSGLSVCSMRLACNGTRRDAEGEYQEQPNYFDVSVFGGQAEVIVRYCGRGRRVAVDGRLAWREWETDEQQRREAVSILADSVEFLDSPDAEAGEGAAQEESAGVGTGVGQDAGVF